MFGTSKSVWKIDGCLYQMLRSLPDTPKVVSQLPRGGSWSDHQGSLRETEECLITNQTRAKPEFDLYYDTCSHREASGYTPKLRSMIVQTKKWGVTHTEKLQLKLGLQSKGLAELLSVPELSNLQETWKIIIYASSCYNFYDIELR